MTGIIKQELDLSSRKRRIAAFMIDHFLVTFLIVSMVFLVFGPDLMEEDFIAENELSKFTWIVSISVILGTVLYLAKDSIHGISAGKWIMGIKVCDAERPEVVPSLGRLFYRNLFIVIWPIEFVILAKSPQKRRLGDKAANTAVIKNPHSPTRLARMLALVGIGVAFLIFTFLVAGLVMKNSEAYKTAVQEIEQNEEILLETGGIKGYGMIPRGNVSISNGKGQAELNITVIGEEKDVEVHLFLTKKPMGKWELVKLNP